MFVVIGAVKIVAFYNKGQISVCFQIISFFLLMSICIQPLFAQF
jgi:hypothetical protein